MPRVVKYKRPRKINVVTVTLAALIGLAVYMGTQYLPLYILRAEAYRVLEETGSHFAGRFARYTSSPEHMDSLRKRMRNQLRMVGVDDPDAEVWIEAEGREARFGVIYSKWITWPFDIVPKQERVYELEHVVPLPREVD